MCITRSGEIHNWFDPFIRGNIHAYHALNEEYIWLSREKRHFPWNGILIDAYECTHCMKRLPFALCMCVCVLQWQRAQLNWRKLLNREKTKYNSHGVPLPPIHHLRYSHRTHGHTCTCAMSETRKMPKVSLFAERKNKTKTKRLRVGLNHLVCIHQ